MNIPHPEQATPPHPTRRRVLKTLGGLGAYAALDHILPFTWGDNTTNIETNTPVTPELTVVAPGINRKHGHDIAAALRPSLGKGERPVASVSYPDRGLSTADVANEIRVRRCKKLGIVGHSMGTGFMIDVLRRLLPELERRELGVDYFIMLGSPFSDQDIKDGRADELSYVPVGAIDKTIVDVVTSGRFNWTSPRLWNSQLDHVVNFDGGVSLPPVAKFIRRALYIGPEDEAADDTIRTHQAGTAYKTVLGKRLTIARVAGIGHANPEMVPDPYNETIAQWLQDTR